MASRACVKRGKDTALYVGRECFQCHENSLHIRLDVPSSGLAAIGLFGFREYPDLRRWVVRPSFHYRVDWEET